MQSVAIAIKTIPDIEAGRRLYKIQELSDEGVAKAMFHLHQQKSGSENLPHYLQRIIMIAVCSKVEGELKTQILSVQDLSEKVLLENYVSVTQGKRQLTWNGNDFEFPVLRYRALKQGVALGDLSHQLDLSCELSPNNTNTSPDLYEMSCFLKLPELQKDNANSIWNAWQNNEMGVIQDSVRRDAENIYQIFSLTE